MNIRVAKPQDDEAVAAIYTPVVAGAAISFELEPPTEPVAPQVFSPDGFQLGDGNED